MSYLRKGKWHGTPAYLGGNLPSQYHPWRNGKPKPISKPKPRAIPVGVKVLTDAEIRAAYPGVPIRRR